jgi:methylmalonyl-CoA/ethylmalonyl-CoA epimerase
MEGEQNPSDSFSLRNLFLMKLEHIGIAVKNLEESNQLFEKILGLKHYKIEEVDTEMVRTSFFLSGSTKIELLEATDENSAIARHIQKRGEGIHHLAFEVENIYKEMVRLENEGFILLNKEPKKGADNKLVCFLHPGNTNKVLVELCQSIKPDTSAT